MGHSYFVIKKKKSQVPSSLCFITVLLLYWNYSAIYYYPNRLFLSVRWCLSCLTFYLQFLAKVPALYDFCNHCLLKDQSFFSEVLLPSPLPLRSTLIPDSRTPHLCFSSNTIVTSLARAFIISHLNYYSSLFIGGPPLTCPTYCCQSGTSQV